MSLPKLCTKVRAYKRIKYSGGNGQNDRLALPLLELAQPLNWTYSIPLFTPCVVWVNRAGTLHGTDWIVCKSVFSPVQQATSLAGQFGTTNIKSTGQFHLDLILQDQGPRPGFATNIFLLSWNLCPLTCSETYDLFNFRWPMHESFRVPKRHDTYFHQYRIYMVKFGRSPLGPNSFNFMQFWENLAKLYVGVTLGGLADPPRGNPGSATFHGTGYCLCHI